MIARESIRDSLVPSEAAGERVTVETLSPMTELEWALTWRLHADCIRSTRVTQDVKMFDVYLSRAFKGIQWRDLAEKPVGLRPASANPAVPLLHPPRPQNWLDAKFSLAPFTDLAAAPPFMSDFKVI